MSMRKTKALFRGLHIFKNYSTGFTGHIKRPYLKNADATRNLEDFSVGLFFYTLYSCIFVFLEYIILHKWTT